MSTQNICNICGANYEYRNGRWVCPACGAYKAEEFSNEEVTLLYSAAQKLRLSDFDEAEQAYADIIAKYPQNSEGYWGRLLSRFGIKYEEDFDGRQIPTCYATIESIMSDKDYAKAVALADEDTKAYYIKQAEYIERVRKEWVEKARKEKPYDIFISYKESDVQNGIDRTQDSIAAQDLYIHLTEKGYRVFFSRESLRDKVGEKYEPYIFNALSTAKVMLVYGSSSEYITSTWVKNEWMRYEKRVQAGEKKKNSLIVACDGFSPSELPKALSSMQCLDATKRTFFGDLDNAIDKIIKAEEKPKEQAVEKKKSKKLPIILLVAALLALLIGVGLPLYLAGNNSSASITDSKYGVVISAGSDIFDKNTSVIVDKLTDGAQYDALVSTVNASKSLDIQNAIIYDIECDADITKNVTIKVAYSKLSADSTVKVYYVSDDKSLIEEHGCIYDDGFVEFKTNHLSYYIIGEIVPPSISEGTENTEETEDTDKELTTDTEKESTTDTEKESTSDTEKESTSDTEKETTTDTEIEHTHTWSVWQVTKNATCTSAGEETRACACGVKEVRDVVKLEHSYTSVVTVPTCTAQGYTTYTCACGDSYKGNYKSETGHSFGSWTTVTDSNCTAKGTERRDCSKCDHYETRTTDPTGHTYTSVVTAPTCTAQGYTTYTCACSHFYKDNYVAATGHSLGSWATVTSPTCTAQGTERRDCSKCDHYETRTSDATGHTYTSVATAPTCTAQGYTTYTCDCGYSYVDAYANALGHNYADGICTKCGDEYFSQGLAYTSSGSGTCYVSGIGTCTDTDIYIPRVSPTGYTVTSIGGSAFNGCTGLTSITIPDSVTSIGSYAFRGCTSLTSVTIPDSVTSIGTCAFNDCTGLTEINFNATAMNYLSSYNYVFSNAGNNGSGITVNIGANVTNIPAYLFYDAPNITSVVFAEGSVCESIGSYAFRDCTGLTSITIPNSVTSIGYSAFNGCTGITSVTIPNSVTSIGYSAFAGCTGLTEINFNATAMNDLIYENGVLYNAGKNGSGITVNIGANVTKIPAYLFYPYNDSSYVPNITSVVFAEGSVCESIGSYAFRDCTGLTSITIPASVTNIENYAFWNCMNLTNITFNGTKQEFHNITLGTSWNMYIPATTVTCSDGTTAFRHSYNSVVTAPTCTAQGYTTHTCKCGASYKDTYVDALGHNLVDGICTICNYGRLNQGLLYASNGDGTCYVSGIGTCTDTSIYIPNVSPSGDRVTGIYDEAFAGCTNLTSVNIPSGVTDTGEWTFAGCTNLTNVELPNGLTRIGWGAFSGCSNITSIEIPDTVTEIYPQAFERCSKLTSISIPDGVTSLGVSVFADCISLESIEIPSSVTSLFDNVFAFCENLASVYYCGDIASWCNISINWYDSHPFGDTRDKGTKLYFKNAEGEYELVTELVIPSTVTEIKSYAFYNCDSIISITFNGTKAQWNAVIKGVDWSGDIPTNEVICTNGSAEDGRFSEGLAFASNGDGTCSVSGIGTCTDTDIYIPRVSPHGDTVTSICNCAFQGYEKLTSITIPDSVTSIGFEAFYGCTGLTSVTIGNGVTSIGNYAFEGCTGLTSVTIPDGVKSIGAQAFYGCRGLTSITIPNSVTSIGDEAFCACSSLKCVTIGTGVTSMGDSAFDGCYALTEINFNATAMNDRDSSNPVFRKAGNNSNGLTVNIGANVQKIPAYIFHNSNITSVTFAEGSKCKSIGSYAFYGTELSSITIPDSVTLIEPYAFFECISLTRVIFENTLGWHLSSFRDSIGTPTSYLANPEWAAGYLTVSYSSYYYIRR